MAQLRTAGGGGSAGVAAHLLTAVEHHDELGAAAVRLLSHRARGFRRVDNLIALIHLVCGELQVELPIQMHEEPPIAL